MSTSRENPPGSSLFFEEAHNSDFGTSNIPNLPFSPNSGVSQLSTSIEAPPSSIARSMAMSVTSEIDITNLPLQALLSNIEVRRLFDHRAHLLDSQTRLVTSQAQLNSDMHGLLTEKQSLAAELAEMRKKMEAMESSTLHPAQLFASSSTTLTKMQSEESVSPSDSISQRGTNAPSTGSTGVPSLAERPADFSPAVLWTAKECHRDSSACKGNRISLTAAIRDKDGTPASNVEETKTTARFHFLSSLMTLPIPLNAPKHQTGLWWKIYRPDEWKKAIRYLEGSHPVVAYCAHHWKAEEVFRVVIQTRLDSERAKKESKRQDRARESQASGPTDVDTAARLQKRPHSATDSLATDPSPSLEKPAALSKPPKKRKHGHQLLDGVFRSAPGESQPKPSESSPTTMILIPSLPTLNVPAPVLLSPPIPVPSSPTTSLPSIPVTSAPVLTRPSNHIDVSKISIPTTVHALSEILSNDFPSIKDSSLLFDAFKLSPNFSAGSPSDEFERWIQTIDAADPNDPALDEDNNFEQWGHQQLSLTSPQLTSWTIVGSVNGACRLIAALVKTCKVAREICQVNQREMSTSFIADIYLDRTIETLWKLWAGYKAENPNVDQVPPLVGSASSLPSPALPLPPPSSGSENVPTPQDPGSASPPLPPPPPVPAPHGLSQKSVQSLKIDELKELIRLWDIEVSAAKPKKDHYVSAILTAPDEKRPTEADIKSIIAKRTLASKKVKRTSGGG
ncbi:hypothetical protein AGABI1DRAFT_129800 [Agaricus bisporus var. burnettii JB137-S8]|uniref:Uncharacterized protein n=1 Tax=Agaricus bisporus var. burnettii (strain JB137-S8 / ATCC MYA-4627 / FGSC 10392) TaxID=597362 RepID=K5X4B5_AGABU|nr:uncharacterized protein AGABI1DRAFT_129800 [Agaricus bisporus var. burnettii JB137-S8]EKM78018.1 hypothetical protein AGABI1DRAFT_129800 [Agaricus bisporus var. burnettii JB137-S8]